MSSITCPHCAQNFDNYNNGVKATRCPRCSGEIKYIEGDSIMDKQFIINHFWKIIVFSEVIAIYASIKENYEWYEIIGAIVFYPIIIVLILFGLTFLKPEHPMKK
jgi:hypothetical protein